MQRLSVSIQVEEAGGRSPEEIVFVFARQPFARLDHLDRVGKHPVGVGIIASDHEPPASPAARDVGKCRVIGSQRKVKALKLVPRLSIDGLPAVRHKGVTRDEGRLVRREKQNGVGDLLGTSHS